MTDIKRIVAVAVGPRRDQRLSDKAIAGNVRPYVNGLIERLGELGHKLGSDYIIDYKERTHPELAKLEVDDLFVDANKAAYDLIFAMSTTVVRSAKDAGERTPIVGVVSDPRKEGFSRSRNITGISARRSQTAGACFEYFLATVPTLKRVRVLHWPGYGPSDRSLKLVRAAAKKRGVGVEVLTIKSRADIEKKLKAMAKRDPQKPAEIGVLVLPIDVCLGAAQMIVDLVQGEKRLPVFFPITDVVNANGAIGGYGVPQQTCGKLMARYVDQILWLDKAPNALKIGDAGDQDFEWTVSREAADALNIRVANMV